MLNILVEKDCRQAAHVENFHAFAAPAAPHLER
jgi:hypothetical protein